MNAVELHEHMMSVGSWVHWNATCDGFKAGDPHAEVMGIAVAWQSTLPMLRRASRKGCNLFVTHEPRSSPHVD